MWVEMILEPFCRNEHNFSATFSSLWYILRTLWLQFLKTERSALASVNVFAFWLSLITRWKGELANCVDGNELRDFTDVVALRWNIMMALKRSFAVAVICIPCPAMFTLSKLECFWAHHNPVLMVLSTSVENQYLGSFRQLNHLWWVCTVFQNVQRGFFFSIRDFKILL